MVPEYGRRELKFPGALCQLLTLLPTRVFLVTGSERLWKVRERGRAQSLSLTLAPLTSCSQPLEKVYIPIYCWAKLLHRTWKISSLTCEMLPSPYWESNSHIWCGWYFKCPKCQLLCCSCGLKKSGAAAEWSLWISPRFREGEACERGCQVPAPHPLERGLAGEAVGLGNRLPSARRVHRPLCAASHLGDSQEWGSLCGHSFGSVSLLPLLHPWVGSAWRAQMEAFLSLHSGC